MNSFKSAAVFALLLLSSSAMAQSRIIAQHIGANDPIGEGFLFSGGPAASVFPVSGGPYGGAWSVNLQGTSAVYTRVLTQQEQEQTTAGWTLSVTFQPLTPYDSSLHMWADAFLGGRDFLISLGATTAGDPMIRVFNQILTLDGAGAGYHNYQIRYDSANQDASFWVDGSHLADGLPPISGTGPADLGWGGGQSGLANANWAEVTLTAIPEPSAMVLLSFAGLLTLLFSCRVRSFTGAKA